MLDIIIVEDNHEIGELLSDFLRKENYIVSVAKDGEAKGYNRTVGIAALQSVQKSVRHPMHIF